MNFGDHNAALQVGVNYGSITTAHAPKSLNNADDRSHRERALDSLRFEQIDARKKDIKKASKETCTWLLGHQGYEAWLDPEKLSEHHGILWISGKPGAGKSTIMKFAYLDMKDRFKTSQERTVIASFFFNARGEDLEKSVCGLYRSLLIQILQGFPDIRKVLDNEELISPSRDRDIGCPPLNALKELLSSAMSFLGQRSLTCFIDALDECDESDIVEMVEHFEDLAEQAYHQNSTFRICYSSRHYPHINIGHGIRFTLEHQMGHIRDLEVYVSDRLKIGNSELCRELKQKLLEKADGVFLWVVLVVEILNKECRRGGFNLRRRLEEMPTNLSHLFKDILLRDTENPEELLLCILWILYSKRPLRPNEFYHALWSGLAMRKHDLVDEKLPDILSRASTLAENTSMSSEELDKVSIYVTSSSKGLAEVSSTHRLTPASPRTPIGHSRFSPGRNDVRVQFIHESVRDYLLKDKGLEDLWPSVILGEEGRAHDMLKKCCRFYMDHVEGTEDRSEIELLRSFGPGNLRGQFPLPSPKLASRKDRETMTFTERYAFLDYATDYILFHAEAAAPSVPQDDFLSLFPLSYWIRVRSFYQTRSVLQRTQPTYPLDTLFHVFARNGLPNLTRTRRKRDQNVHVLGGDQNNTYPFFVALAYGYKDTAVALLNLPDCIYKGADILEGFSHGQAYRDERPFKDRTPLSWAAEVGRLEIVKLLLVENSIPVNPAKKGQKSALARAVENGHKNVSALLLENGANVKHSEPLLKAIEIGREDIVSLLLESGADINRWDPLSRASELGHEGIVRLLLKKGVDVHHGSPVKSAVRGGHAAIVKLLLENNADANKSSPLECACQLGLATIVGLLIENGANVNNVAPLRIASRRGHHAIMRILIQKGADVNQGGLLADASKIGCKTTVEILLSNGANVNAQDEQGNTALHQAAYRHDHALAKLLVAHGANFDQEDRSGTTPHDVMYLTTRRD
ncbi:Pfs NACHT and ankyrin domain protein [Penicillium cosmopolitanum]|uniref:Pfs NACHT and ankyrin domain protein n=1 Tax=Penicillium cosmopolitanum TaxID=1131564 RepID=A0A9W9WBS5_9EURO|nr:Pfs NACHT and ankyrin domain protein [Penicillium cosmopolitanum]KAJ5414609.1 Pfs NACHT and ankyrin domain protein [Penicillium cosmopolitanum]